jgi:hypothetical protein
MASFLERTQNLIDDHQDRQASAEIAKQRAESLGETRDALLGKVLELQHSYRDELAVAAGPEARKAIHSSYAARFEGINDAFTVLRQAEPGITTKIDGDELRRDAERHAELQAGLRAYEESLSQTRNSHSKGLSRTVDGAGFSY